MVDIKITVKSVETTDEGTLVIEMSPYPYARWIQTEALADANVAVQPYGVIMVPEAATFTPGGLTVDVEVKGYIFSVPLATLMEADAEDQIEFISPYITVADLADVDLTNLQNGQTLIWDSTNNVWVNGSAGGSESLEDLTDVDITSVSNGDTLVWDSTAEKWVNSAGGGGGGEHEWVSIFKDSTTLLPLDSITVTASGGRAALTDVFYAPLPSKTVDTVIVQSVKVIIDDVELITKAILAMGSLVIMNASGNQPLIMFQPATTGISAMAVLQDGEHEISCYIDNITNECYYKSNQGSGTAADPYSLYDERIGDLVDNITLMAIVSQCRPITIIGDEPLNAETATGFNYSFTDATTYDITVYAGIHYYGLKAGGSD